MVIWLNERVSSVMLMIVWLEALVPWELALMRST